jgi:hypothetical protein
MARMARVVVPSLPLISFLSVPTGPLTTIWIERAPTIGRPLGAPEWIAVLERRLGHRSATGNPGPKPRADRETNQEPEE